jgi:DNA repair exonuclease SbcCD nuclease subunit
VEALNTRKGEWEDARCIFGHQTISGAKGADGNVIIAKDAEKWPEGFPMLVSGHIHGSHWLGPNMYYTGSILQVSVDEDPNKHVALVSIAPGTGLPKIEEISLGLPCKKILHLDYKELEDDFKMPSEPNTKYMLYISCSFEEFRVFKRSTLYKSLLKLPQLQSGAKGIKHKPTKAEVKNAVKRIEDLRGRHLKRFDDILEEAVAQDADPYLTSFHETMMAGEDDEVEDLSELLEEVLVIKPKAASAAEEKEDENA